MEPEDVVPLEERYRRKALAATQAAREAINWEPYGSHQSYLARIEAFGRIAAALIIADGDARG